MELEESSGFWAHPAHRDRTNRQASRILTNFFHGKVLLRIVYFMKEKSTSRGTLFFFPTMTEAGERVNHTVFSDDHLMGHNDMAQRIAPSKKSMSILAA